MGKTGKAMWTMVQKLRLPSGPSKKQIMLGLVLGGVALAAFGLGRHSASGGSKAGQDGNPDRLHDPMFRSASYNDSNYDRRPVAYIHKSIPITREDLGEYLIARFGMQRVEFLVNRRIVEMECKRRGIEISDTEIENQFQQDLKTVCGTPLTQEQFVNQILRRSNKTLYEWKEDVIRPRLMLLALARPRVKVTEEDLKNAFEAKYGDKVQCRMIVLAKGTPQNQMDEIWAKVRKSENDFREAARSQFIPGLASKEGEVPPIHHHFGGPDGAEIEKEAFSLKEGDVSRLLRMPEPDGSTIILRCEKRLPPDTTKSLTNSGDRLALHKEVFEFKLQQETNAVFDELRKDATPYLLLVDESHRSIPPPLPAKGATVPPGTVGEPVGPGAVPTSSEGSRSTPPPLPNQKPD
jgi:hypothetical protein